ncbi:Tryptophan synthase, beta chain-like protein [Corchorus olitorius]|uniref:Tryptophan synthase, beta chain-like protein n=1 Tax=Corchorus olitorius TaxID=93759 RepID=A0A1R3KS93_9ROSI|nr:Tryptophan synthase, beta chain-like protein [Corchorus olitorius]
MHIRLSNGYRVRARLALAANSTAIEILRQWYNLIVDPSVKPSPPLHPKTFEPVKPEDLAPLFPDELIKHEATNERFQMKFSMFTDPGTNAFNKVRFNLAMV